MNGPVPTAKTRTSPLKNPRRFLALGFGFLLALPLLQMSLHILHERPLAGVEGRHKPITLSLKSWWDGNLAKSVESQTARNIGFRPSLIRTSNQMQLAFGLEPEKLQNDKVMVSKENCLFSGGYVLRYASPRDDLADSQLQQLVADLKELQERLRAQGTAMVLVISPSKAETLPEYLPDWALEKRKNYRGETNLDRLRTVLEGSGVVAFDTPRYFQQTKQTSPDTVLFTKRGIHWSYMAAFHVWREVLQLVNHEYGTQWPIPEQIDVEYDRPRGTDHDIAKLLNVYYLPGVEDPIPYPIVRTNSLPVSSRPDFLFTGTSFTRTLINSMYLSESGNACDFLYYNSRHLFLPEPVTVRRAGRQVKLKEVYVDGFEGIDWDTVLVGKEVVVLEMLESHVDDLLHGTHTTILNALRQRDRLAARP